MSGEGERLQKVLARAGLGSRRAVEELIRQGRVRVNGERAILGRRVDPAHDEVEVDGSRVPLGGDLKHLLLNKPAGVITTSSDPEGRPSVLEYVGTADRVWPVGRLDIDSSGALLLTNDGPLTHRLTHPSFSVPKTYVAETTGRISARALRRLSSGVPLEDGLTGPAQVRLLDRTAVVSLVEITIGEGRNRQVRRMLEAVGHPVRSLVRTAIGPLQLGRLAEGTVRNVRPDEVRALYRVAGL